MTLASLSKKVAKHATQLNHQILKFLRGYVHCLNCKDGGFEILELNAENILERYTQKSGNRASDPLYFYHNLNILLMKQLAFS